MAITAPRELPKLLSSYFLRVQGVSGPFTCPDMGERLFRASLISPADVF